METDAPAERTLQNILEIGVADFEPLPDEFRESLPQVAKGCNTDVLTLPALHVLVAFVLRYSYGHRLSPAGCQSLAALIADTLWENAPTREALENLWHKLYGGTA